MVGGSLFSLGSPYSSLSTIVSDTKVKLVGYSARTIDVHAHVDKKGTLIIQYNLCIEAETILEGEKASSKIFKDLDKNLQKELKKAIDKNGRVKSYKLQRFKILYF